MLLAFEDERQDTSHLVVICDDSVVIHVNLHQFERIVVVELVSDVVEESSCWLHGSHQSA
jgi:hypothetical protein